MKLEKWELSNTSWVFTGTAQLYGDQFYPEEVLEEFSLGFSWLSIFISN